MSEAELRIVRATIVFVDVVESVRLMALDERRHVGRVRQLLTGLAQQLVPRAGGQVLERRGDGLLARFDDPRAAAACALAMHAQAAATAEPADGTCVAPAEPLWLRIGLHCADLLADADDALYGQGLNLTARLAALAQPGESWLSAVVRDQLTDALDGLLLDLGEVHLKHLDEPVRAYRLLPAAPEEPEAHAAGDATGLAVGGLAGHGRVEGVEASVPPPPLAMSPPADIRPRLAVLPLTWAGAAVAAMAPDAGDVLVDQLAQALSACRLLQVTSMLSANAFRGRGSAPVDAAARLAADYVLAGEREASDAAVLVVQLRLLHAASGQCVWQLAWQGAAALLAAPDQSWLDEVVAAVVQALTDAEFHIARGRPLPNLAAHTLYLASVSLLHRFSHSDFMRAHQMLLALRERAPRHAAPAAWLARWHVFRIVQGWSPEAARDGALASDHAQRALDRDPDSSLALTMAGSVRAGVHLDMPGASHYYELALSRNPSEPLAWLLKGVAHGFLGEGVAALDASERSLQLSPLDPLRFYYDSLSATAAMGAQRYARAAELAQRAIRANCMHGSSYRALAISQVMLGQVESARATVTRLRAVEPGSSVRQFQARAAVDSAQNRLFAQALVEAGLPPG